MDVLVNYLTLSEKDRYLSLEQRLNRWVGIVGEVPSYGAPAAIATIIGEPVLDEKLDWRDLGKYEVTAKALAVVRSISRLFREECVTQFTNAMYRSLLWAEATIMRQNAPELEADLQECRWCLRRTKKYQCLGLFFPFR